MGISMRQRKSIPVMIAILAAGMFAAEAGAAEIRRSENSLSVEGKITSTTDQLFAIKLSELLLETPPEKDVVIQLNSPGGNVSAALRMAKIIRSISQYAKVVTEVKADKMCGSACPLILFSSSHFIIHDTSLFLFHQPTLKAVDESALTRASEEIDKATEFYLQEIQRQQPKLAKFLRDEHVLEGMHGDVVLMGSKLKRLLVKR